MPFRIFVGLCVLAACMLARPCWASSAPQASVRIHTDPRDATLFECVLSGGAILEFFGERDADGLPARATWIRCRMPNQAPVQVYLDAHGHPDFIEVEGSGSVRVLRDTHGLKDLAVYDPAGSLLGQMSEVVDWGSAVRASREARSVVAGDPPYRELSDVAQDEGCAYAYIRVGSCQQDVIRDDVLSAWITLDGQVVRAVRIGKGLFRAPLRCRPRRLQAAADVHCDRIDRIMSDTCPTWQYVGLDVASSTCLTVGLSPVSVAAPWLPIACQSLVLIHHVYCGLQMDRYGLPGRGISGSVCEMAMEIVDHAADVVQGGDVYHAKVQAFASLRDCDVGWSARSAVATFDSRDPQDLWLDVDGCQSDRRPSWRALVRVPQQGAYVGDSRSAEIRPGIDALGGSLFSETPYEEQEGGASSAPARVDGLAANKVWPLEVLPTRIDLPSAADPWISTVFQPTGSLVFSAAPLSGSFVSSVRIEPRDQVHRSARPGEEASAEILSKHRIVVTSSSSMALHSFWLQTGDTARINVSIGRPSAVGPDTSCSVRLTGMAGVTPFRRGWEFSVGQDGSTTASPAPIVLRFADLAVPTAAFLGASVPAGWTLAQLQAAVASGELAELAEAFKLPSAAEGALPNLNDPEPLPRQQGPHCIQVFFMVQVKTSVGASRGARGEGVFVVHWDVELSSS